MPGLLGDEYKEGTGIPFIALEGEGDDAKFRVTEEAKEFLATLKAPIALASIVGRYRTGKSLLVNRMLLDVTSNGFQVGSTVNSCTKGLWIWDKPLKTKLSDGSEVNLLIIDTEGIGSLDADADHDAKIFALALLLSSYFIYNSVGSIDEQALNALSLVVELTKHIKTKAESDEPETGAEFSQFFPSFLWVVRDFSLMLVDESGAPFTPKQYLERSLTPIAGFSEGVEVKNRIRRMLLAFFPSRDCVTLKRPVEDEGKLQQLDRADWSEFRPEFVDQVKELREKIYTSAPAKTLNGKMLDGFMISHLACAYAESINSGTSLNIGDAWSQVSKSKNIQAVEEGKEDYKKLAHDLEASMPMPVADLEEKHLELQAEVVKTFKKNCIGTGQDIEQYMTMLQDALRVEYGAVQDKNKALGKQVAEECLKKLYEPLSTKVDEKAFEDFKTFETERLKVRKEYIDTAPENPSKMEVLWAFMEEQVPGAAAKIAANNTLKVEKLIQEKDAALSEATSLKEQAELKAKGLEEEMSTKLGILQKEHGEAQEREKELKETLERDRADAKKQLEEETAKAAAELASIKEKLESELSEAKASGKAALEAAEAEASENKKKSMLLENAAKYKDEELEKLKKDKELAAESEKGLKNEISALKGQVAEAEKAKKGVDEELEKKQKTADKAREEHEKALKGVQEQLAAAEAKVAEVTGQLDKEKSEKDKLETTAKEQSAAQAGSLKAAEEAATKEKEAYENKIKELETKVESLSKENGETSTRAQAAETKVSDLEAKLGETETKLSESETKLSESAKLLSETEDKAKQAEAKAKDAEDKVTAAEQAKEKAVSEAKESGAAAAAAAAASATAAAATKPAGQSVAETDEMRAVVERQARMQEAFNEESNRLQNRIAELESECDRYKQVLHKLSAQIENGNASGGLTAEDLSGFASQLRSKVFNTTASSARQNGARPAENGAKAGPKPVETQRPNIPDECSRMSATRESKGEGWVVVDQPEPARPKNQIVFKPLQQDVYAQVAKQTNQTTEDVYRAHEAGRATQGVAASGVGSGEKFSFARLRQAISKKVTGAINKVDEWADNVEGVLMGTNSGPGGGQGAPATPPRPSEGGFYAAGEFKEEDAEAARGVLKNLSWTPDDKKVSAGKERIAQFKEKKPAFDVAKGFSPGGAPTVEMQKEDE